MDGVNRPGGNQQVPPADEQEDTENMPSEPAHKPQTGFGERPKGKSLADRMRAKQGGITTVDGGPTVRQTKAPPAEDGSDGGDNS